MLKDTSKDEGAKRLAEVLNRGWRRYAELFGEEPHGTVRQITAMLSLCPEISAYIDPYEKKREEAMTV